MMMIQDTQDDDHARHKMVMMLMIDDDGGGKCPYPLNYILHEGPRQAYHFLTKFVPT